MSNTVARYAVQSALWVLREVRLTRDHGSQAISSNHVQGTIKSHRDSCGDHSQRELKMHVWWHGFSINLNVEDGCLGTRLELWSAATLQLSSFTEVLRLVHIDQPLHASMSKRLRKMRQ